MDWLLAPIDATRAHEIGFAVSWHARLMVVAWGVLAPLAVLVARFFKVMPGQNWPQELDNQTWWRSHWMGQSIVVGLSVMGLVLVLPSDIASMTLHNWLGYAVLVGATIQIVLGLFRGSKGGPTDTQMRGHHYDMTPWRRAFEALHKTIGYGTICAGIVAIVLGLWKANAPVWMWLTLTIWWAALFVTFALLQRRGMAVDTYQAIWGTDPRHPGNKVPAASWGMRRVGDVEEGKDNVRHHRGNRVRSH